MCEIEVLAAQKPSHKSHAEPYSRARGSRFCSDKDSPVSPQCMPASPANPYHYKIYFPVLDYMVQHGFYDLVSELQAPQFRTLCEWLMLGIAVGTSFIL